MSRFLAGSRFYSRSLRTDGLLSNCSRTSPDRLAFGLVLGTFLLITSTAAYFGGGCIADRHADSGNRASSAGYGAESLSDGTPTVRHEPGPLRSSVSSSDSAEPRLLRLRRPQSDGQLGLPIGVEDADGQSMKAFHAALRRAERGEGKARLLFYGASHVASDSFTGWIRAQLQTRFGDAGHGFVMPVHPWRTYVHQGVSIESDRRRWVARRVTTGFRGIDYFGLAGVSVETEEQGAFGQVGTVSRGPVGRQVDQFELWYLRQPQGGSFEVWIDGRAQDVVSTDADEPTADYRLYRVPDGPHQLRIVARGDGLVRAFGVVMERDASGVVLDTLGINGARARLHLQWNDDLYREHLARRQPDLVVLAYGTNESGDPLPIPTYEAQLRRVLRRIRDVVPSSSCLLVGPSDRPVQGESGAWEALPRVQEINETQRRLALEFGCGYFDLLAFMGGPLSMVDWVALDFGARDHIHLTAKGYRRLAEELFAAMMEGFSPEFAAGDLPLPPQTVFQE